MNKFTDVLSFSFECPWITQLHPSTHKQETPLLGGA